jgi:type I restriction enzyme R subunit
LDDDKLTQYAFDIDDIVKTAVAEYSINPAEIENTISKKLLPMLFGDLGIENAQRFIQEVLQIARLGIARA